MADYDFAAIEAKWQAYWAGNGTFCQANPGDADFDEDKPKMYVLDMFPYPSGAGLHVGHPEGYTATDIVCRYKRMKGFNVLHPMGYDSFGLPAEQYAVEHGVHPRQTTAANIANIERQIKMFGFSYDWSRRLATTDVDYYRWTQWIFLRLFNSWYDPAENAARPIEELVNALVNGKYMVSPTGQPVTDVLHGVSVLTGEPAGLINFHELPPEKQREVIDGQRLAYQAEVPVNWCPKLGTVLANEEVTNEGRSGRGDYPVFRRALKQWMLRITSYADRLADDVADMNWPEPIKIMQRNWIGRSEGADVDFAVVDFPEFIRVYTTRPDTLFGATYMVLAPEHQLVQAITTDEQKDAVEEYVRAAARKSELERTADAKSKTGVWTGAFAINPVNDEKVPIWVADYVMMGYGTGAIMAVPAHDTRDYEFAKAFDLPIVPVVMPPDLWLVQYADTAKIPGLQAILDEGWPNASHDAKVEVTRRLRGDYLANVGRFSEAFIGLGTAVNSGQFDGLDTGQFKERITAWLEEKDLGKAAVNYKLRDWLFSRQRYWGEPFPIVHCEHCGTVGLPDDQLPLELPEMDDFSPATSDDPESLPSPPLGKLTDWVNTTCPTCGGPATRELNTMPQWAGSCWYYLRYLDNTNDEAFVAPAVERYWMAPGEDNPAGGVDLYIGGEEHAVLHLLYARFWHKVLFDLGLVSTGEPFGRLFNQGMIRSFAYRDRRGVYLGYNEVDTSGDKPVHAATGEEVAESIEKMSKSLKNVVNPDDVIGEYGADTFRLYEMFMGPLEASKPWNTRDVPGVYRFLQRTWRMICGGEDQAAMLSPAPADNDVERALHKVVKKVGQDYEAMKFNTAIAAMMEFVNTVFRAGKIAPGQAERFVLILAPLAPHIAEELWQRLGHDASLAYEPWPTYDEAMLVETTVELAVQVNGKMRGRISVSADASDDDVIAAALADAKVAADVEGKTIVKKIVVSGRLVNLVAK